MFEFECEGKNGINKLSLTTDDFEKFSKVMGLVDKFSRDEEEVKPIFTIENYNNGKYVIHCDTEEKAKIFCEYLDDNWEKWQNWESGIDYMDEYNWKFCKENTCYNFYRGEFDAIEYYENEGYAILEFDDYDWSDWED